MRFVANSITRTEVNAIPIKDYESVRSGIRSGDLLFCSGTYLVSKLIQKATRSPWSHVGIIFVLKTIDRILLLESVEDVGVRFAPLSKYLSDYENGRPYKGSLVVARSSAVTAEIARAIASFGTDELTCPYDKEDIGQVVARIALGIGRRQKDREYICSELVAECFSRGGIDMLGDGGYVTPEDVWTHDTVRQIARLQ
jgi:hypothetical protein